MEVLAGAKANGLTIQVVYIPDYTDMPDGTFDEGIIRNALHALVDLAFIFWRRLRGLYRTNYIKGAQR